MTTQAEQTKASGEALVGQVADEFTLRLNRGEQPSIEEYVEKYPQIAQQLRQMLPALKMLRRPDVEAALAEGDPNLAEPLGDFRLIREIGRGGMGVVYEAKQLSLNRPVAVKVLPFAAAMDARQLKRFKNEAQLAACLHHEHIVPVYSIGCERNVHFYAMQYIEGMSLAAIIAELRRMANREQVQKAGPADPERTGPYLSPSNAPSTLAQETTPLSGLTTEGSTRTRGYFERVARLGLEAAKGLDHAHQGYVLHRDIKPANLIVDARGSLWITDFGLAHLRGDTSLTMTGELIGTLRYMSPEQALAKRVVVDQRTDIYSLGATLYELLTLEPVFRGSDRQELLRQIAFDDPRSPRRLNRHVPRDLETIVLTALAKSPAHRYTSAREMAEDLQRFLNNEPIKKRPEGTLRWLWRRSRRHALSLLLGLSVIVTAVILLLFLLHLNRPSPEEEEDTRQQGKLTAHNQNLEQNNKVILIGESGRPGYFRWVTDEKPGKILSAQDGEFKVQNWESGLVELLPDPKLERYRFSAEVRHESRANHESRVGIYFAHSRRPDGETAVHFHCNVAFNDLEEVGSSDANGIHRGNGVGLQVHRQTSTGLNGHKAYVSQAETFFTPAKVVTVGVLGPWRKIAVEVRPETINVFWEGNCIAKVTRDTLMRSARPLFARPDQPLPPNTARFAPRDGLGLYVSQGVATFRNVIVEPLGAD